MENRYQRICPSGFGGGGARQIGCQITRGKKKPNRDNNERKHDPEGI